MKRIFWYLAVAGLLTWSSSAFATSFTFVSNDGSGRLSDMRDLEHGYYYGWSIADNNARALGRELTAGATIVSARLTYANIYNWVYEPNDQLNSFLLSAPPPLASTSQVVPVTRDGVPQGHNVYTYTKTTTTSSNITTTNPNYSPPAGYIIASRTYQNGRYYYKITKTTTTTKTGLSTTPPKGYTLDPTKTKFVQDTVTLSAGTLLSSNLWQRADQQSTIDVVWGTDSFRIQDVNGATNPWHDPVGRQRGFDLIYNFDQDSINALFEYALDGTFGLGIDPDCHYYNDGITLEVQTAPVPEPSTLLLLGAGLLGGVILRRRSHKS